jgi:hypothetical protein
MPPSRPNAVYRHRSRYPLFVHLLEECAEMLLQLSIVCSFRNPDGLMQDSRDFPVVLHDAPNAKDGVRPTLQCNGSTSPGGVVLWAVGRRHSS